MFNFSQTITSRHVRTLTTAVALSVAGLTALSGCGISEQVQQAKAFKGVDVRLVGVEQATLAGIDVTQVRKAGDLSTVQKAALLAGYEVAGDLVDARLHHDRLVARIDGIVEVEDSDDDIVHRRQLVARGRAAPRAQAVAL